MTVIADLSAQNSIPQTTVASRHEVRTWLATMAAVLAIYVLLQNRYWVPGGDSEVYTAIARNLASGNGYMFNGQPVSMVPPGWPMVMAGVMKISPQFLWLKLLTMSCMIGSLSIMYWICRRFASAELSAGVILLSAVLSHIYLLTIWLHSDALFCLISSAQLLLAFQISEGRAAKWRGAVLIVLCAAAVVVRWAGLLSWFLTAMVLLKGEFWPRENARWFRAAATGIITLGMLLTLRIALTVSPQAQQQISAFGGTGDDPGGTIVETADKTVAVAYPWLSQTRGFKGYIARFGLWGNWFSYLIWQPFRLNSKPLGVVSLLLGWLVLGLLCMLAWRGMKSRDWFWPGLIIYSLGLALNWSHPTPRYLVPVAPIILLGVFLGLQMAPAFIAERIARWVPANRAEVRIARYCRSLWWWFIVSYVACNGALYAVDVRVARSGNFYDAYEAGMDKDLIAACRWLDENPPKDGEITVSQVYINMGQTRVSRFGLRATALLTGKAIVSLPLRYTRMGDPHKSTIFLNWARDLGVKYLLYEPEVSPWRVFHFRMGWLQELLTHQPAIDTGAGWRLYRIPPTGDEAIRISLEAGEDWPTRVPGI